MAPSPTPATSADVPVPARAGIGLKFQHVAEILTAPERIVWVEAHAENFMNDGGPTLRVLDAVRDRLPLSLHGVGLSIGGSAPLDRDHLARLARLAVRAEPALLSEHLAWCGAGGSYLNDLLPLLTDAEALSATVDHVDQVQEALGRTILLENPSLYLAFAGADISEPEFLNEVAARTGCSLLLDVNNVVVSAGNLGFDPVAYLDALDLSRVGEIHLAGHHRREVDGAVLRIDDHGSPVCAETWALYARVLGRTGPRPTLIEWDTDVPDLAVLLAEAAKADRILEDRTHDHAA